MSLFEQAYEALMCNEIDKKILLTRELENHQVTK